MVIRRCKAYGVAWWHGLPSSVGFLSLVFGYVPLVRTYRKAFFYTITRLFQPPCFSTSSRHTTALIFSLSRHLFSQGGFGLPDGLNSLCQAHSDALHSTIYSALMAGQMGPLSLLHAGSTPLYSALPTEYSLNTFVFYPRVCIRYVFRYNARVVPREHLHMSPRPRTGPS